MTQVKWEPYHEYRDSEVAWLRDMPLHWELHRAKTIFKRVQRPTHPEDGVVTAFRDGEVTLRSNRRVDGFTNALKEIGYQGVRAGDLLIHAMDGFAGAIGVSDSHGKCSPVCSVCIPQRPEQLDVTYYGYLIRQLAVTGFITSLAKGIRERSTEFRFGEFAVLELAVPPKSEQTQIAKFLDYETARIDALIEKQQQLIALLKEKREGLLHVAINEKGTESVRLEHCWERVNRPVSRRDDQMYYPIGLLNRGRGIFRKEPTLGCDLGDSDFYCVEKGDLIFSGQFAWEGAVSMAGEEENGCVVTHRYPIVRGRPGVAETAFLWAFFDSRSGNFLLNESSRGAAGRNRPLNINALMKEKVPVPPLDAQRAVAKLVFQEKALRERIQGPIALLKERRTALISAAVTGKIDVRDWKAPESAIEEEIA